MTNKKLTDTEVKKAFECCYTDKGGCDECPYYSREENRCIEDGDFFDLPNKIFDLINRKEAEIEAWKHYYNECLTDLKNAHAEIEKLKNEVGKEFTCFVGDPHKVEYCPYLEELETSNTEIEKIKKDLRYYLNTNEENGVVYIPKFIINNLLKEKENDNAE